MIILVAFIRGCPHYYWRDPAERGLCQCRGPRKPHLATCTQSRATGGRVPALGFSTALTAEATFLQRPSRAPDLLPK